MDFKNLITNRRAVNFFDPEKSVSDKQIREVIEMAATAPSSFNLQPWNLLVLREKEEKLRLQKLAWNQPKVSQAPVVFVVLADRDGWKEGHSIVEKDFQEMIKAGSMTEGQRQWFADARQTLYGSSPEAIQAFVCKNTGFFAMSLMLAAKSLGLDTHPMDGFDHEGVRKELNIPDNFWIPLLIAVGYFDKSKELALPKWRKSVDEIVKTF
ncbi:MAG: nitroreductase family protein [Desulfobacterium sp.]|nr:nitroreductase family protein [Desulfobacterium sp.]